MKSTLNGLHDGLRAEDNGDEGLPDGGEEEGARSNAD